MSACVPASLPPEAPLGSIFAFLAAPPLEPTGRLAFAMSWQQGLPPGWFDTLARPPLPRRAAAASIPPARRRRPALRRLGAVSAAAVVLVVSSRVNYAQSLDQYFPTGLTGFNDTFTTVTNRARSGYDPLGIRAGSFLISPELSQSLGYDSNPLASGRPRGAGISDTEASVTANSNWSNHALGGFAAVDSQNYVGSPRESHTDFRVAASGRLDLAGRDQATLAVSHFDLHQTADQLNAVSLQEPLHYTVDEIRSTYLAKLGDLSLRPSLEYTAYHFDDATIAGLSANQGFRSRDVLQGGVTASYAFAPNRSVVVTGTAVKVDYTSNPAGTPSRNSTGGSILAGLDYSENDIFRYRALVGLEVRQFKSSIYRARYAPIVQADVIWTLSPLTTLTGSVRRAIEDASDESLIGYTDTQAKLVVDHEYARNLLLQGRLAVDSADYLQNGGSATVYSAGASVTYLIDRNLRLTASTDIQARRGTVGGDFVRDITLLRLQAQL